MKYIVKRMPENVGPMEVAGGFRPDMIDENYASLNEVSMDQYVWEGDYKPEAHARVGWNSKGLQVLLYAREDEIKAECTEISGKVCCDSCMEFFFMPFPDTDKRYFNAEMNPIGTLHLGLGEGRPNRVKVRDKLPEGFEIRTSGHADGWWAISYTFPMSKIEEAFGKTLTSGSVMKGNFYKCDESMHPHFGTWAPVTAPQPDFHRPECFADIVLE